MTKKKSGKASASRAGNYTEYDLGEKVDQAMRSLGAHKFRPGHSSLSGKWLLGEKFKIPANLKPRDLIGGGLLGVVAQRTLQVATPAVTKLDPGLATDAINFGLGLIPFIAVQNSLTVGVAIPGLFQVAGRLTDLVLDQVNLRKMLSGPTAPKQVAGGAARDPQQTAQALRHMAGQARAAQATAARAPAFSGTIH